jgi:RNA polymerase sigma-70 factor (ECF subfamily)
MRSKITALANHADRKQVAAVLRGDEAAFKAFFDDYYPRLYRFALSRLRHDHETAEDMAQQTLAKALRHMADYRGEARLFTWLCTICRHQIIDWQRKHAAYDKNVVPIEDIDWVRAAVESLSSPNNDEPQTQAHRSDLIRLIHVALDQLPQHYGDALEWKYMQELSVKEISERLGLGLEATRSLLARAKRAFVQVYAPLGEGLSETLMQDNPS